MNIFLICKVRGLMPDDEQYKIQQRYVESLEKQGHRVHWPHRNTKQKDPERGTGICRTTFWAIFRADRVDVIFDPTSEGFVADTMMTFVLNELGKIKSFSWFIKRKRVFIVNPEAVEDKIREEVAVQISRGANPRFVKSYTMVLRNLADETADL